MDREFLDLIKKTEAEAAAVIEEAKIKAAEIEKEGERNAEELGSGTRAEWAKLKETKLGEAKYKVKKIYDNKKTFLTVALNDKKLMAEKKLDQAASLIVERILES